MRGYYHDLNTRYHVSRPTPGLHSPHCPSKAILLGIPTETRNAIYGLVINTNEARSDKSRNGKFDNFGWRYSRPESSRQKDKFAYPEDSISIRHTPPILQVCTQIRNEAQKMFLASNDFVAIIKKSNDTYDPMTDPGYGYLLNILTSLGLENVKTIKSISILCRDSCHGTDFRWDPQHGLVDMWKKFLPELLARGVQIEQLRWPGVCLPKRVLESHDNPWEEPKGVERYGTSESFRQAVLSNFKRIAELYKCVIQPTLWMYSCISLDHPIPNVLKQVEGAKVFKFSIGRNSVPDTLFDSFNRARYDQELDPVRKEYWRKQGIYWGGGWDSRKDYRAMYPPRRYVPGYPAGHFYYATGELILGPSLDE